METKPTEEELRNMIDKGMTLYQISRKYNTTIPVIFQLEKEYGIIFKTSVLRNYYTISKEYYTYSKEDIESMYIGEGMTQQQISQELGCSTGHVHDMMNYYHIQARWCGKYNNYNDHQRSLLYDKIEQYYKDGKSMCEIAEEVGYTTQNVGRILRERGVPIRQGGKYTSQQRASIYDEIVRIHNDEHLTQEEIGKKVGYSPGRVCIILHERGVQTIGSGRILNGKLRYLKGDEIAQMYNEGRTLEEIAKEFGCSISLVHTILHERGVQTRVTNGNITYQDMSLITADKLQECIDKGMNQHQITEYFNVHDVTICKLAEKFGIPGIVGNYRYTTPEYSKWRRSVLERGNYTCQMCGKTGVRLEVHHIIRWADAPELRYNVDNGVPLCHECHQKVTYHEYEYAQQFLDITQPQYRDHDIIESMPWQPPLELHSIIDYPEEKGVITP